MTAFYIAKKAVSRQSKEKNAQENPSKSMRSSESNANSGNRIVGFPRGFANAVDIYFEWIESFLFGGYPFG